MGIVKQPLRIALLVFIVALSGSPVADAHFLASSRVMERESLFKFVEPVLETVDDKLEDGAKKANALEKDIKKTASENSQNSSGESDNNMAKAGEAYKPRTEHAFEKRHREHTEAPKYPIIFACHANLARVFAKYTETWWHDWKLWVGFIFWCAVSAKWFIHGYNEVYYQRGLHAFGVNIIILHILQYSSSTLTGMLWICMGLIGQTLFWSYWGYEANAADHEMDEFVCNTLYLDLGLPIEQITVLFVAQVGVWWFYMTSILGNFDFSKVNYLFWVWAYLVMQITMIFNRGPDSVLGEIFPMCDVQRIMNMANQAEFQLLDGNDEKQKPVGEKFQISKANIIMRGITGFFCNAILRDIMAYTIPLMLMGFSEPMDFVVYCVGVNFICTLDDMSERKYAMTCKDGDPTASGRRRGVFRGEEVETPRTRETTPRTT